MRRATAWALSAIVLFLCTTARAEDAADEKKDDATVDLTEEPVESLPEEPEGTWLDRPAERRCGFSFGAGLGGMVGGATGYPNDAVKIGRDAFETDTGAAGGFQAAGWIGMTPADWISFGVGGGYGRILSADHDTAFGGAWFHIDAFPAFVAGGAWRDLGLMLEAGLGVSVTVEQDDRDNKVIDSAGASRFAFGVFYEGIRAWKFSMGPFAAYDMMWSPSAFRPTAWIGWRTALYAGP